MIDIHSKYDSIHTNKIFSALICINNHIMARINYMSSHLSFTSFAVSIRVKISSGVKGDLLFKIATHINLEKPQQLERSTFLYLILMV